MAGSTGDYAVLDNPAWSALTGDHAAFAQVEGKARRYEPEVSFLSAVPDFDDPEAWGDLARLAGPGTVVRLNGSRPIPPRHWNWGGGTGPQYLFEGDGARPDDEAVPLGADDAEAMAELTGHAKPGPWFPRTWELGGYLGIRRDGRLVAMAGTRLSPAGFTEISAVSTHEDYRGQGLGERLVLAVAHEILRAGKQPMLHTNSENWGARRLYERIGFRLRTNIVWVEATVPDNA